MFLGGRSSESNEDLIIWSASEIGWVCIACMAPFMAVCFWRLGGSLRRGGRKRSPVRSAGRGAFIASAVLLGLLMVQLMLGAAVRHSGAARAITDAPLVFGKVLPPMSQARF